MPYVVRNLAQRSPYSDQMRAGSFIIFSDYGLLSAWNLGPSTSSETNA